MVTAIWFFLFGGWFALGEISKITGKLVDSADGLVSRVGVLS